MFYRIRKFGELLDHRLCNRHLYPPIAWALWITLLCAVSGLIGIAVAWVSLATGQVTNLDTSDIFYFTLIVPCVLVAGFLVFIIHNIVATGIARKRANELFREDPLAELQARMTSLGQDVARAIVLVKAGKTTQPDRRLGEVRAILLRAHGVMVVDAVLRDAQLHRAREAFEAETAST